MKRSESKKYDKSHQVHKSYYYYTSQKNWLDKRRIIKTGTSAKQISHRQSAKIKERKCHWYTPDPVSELKPMVKSFIPGILFCHDVETVVLEIGEEQRLLLQKACIDASYSLAA